MQEKRRQRTTILKLQCVKSPFPPPSSYITKGIEITNGALFCVRDIAVWSGISERNQTWRNWIKNFLKSTCQSDVFMAEWTLCFDTPYFYATIGSFTWNEGTEIFHAKKKWKDIFPEVSLPRFRHFFSTCPMGFLRFRGVSYKKIRFFGSRRAKMGRLNFIPVRTNCPRFFFPASSSAGLIQHI